MPATARMTRRLFVVPLADNNHGKSYLMNRIVEQGERRFFFEKAQKGPRDMRTPWGRLVDALVFVRSYQETLRQQYGSVLAALNAEDPKWRKRELVILPSHLSPLSDLDEIVGAAHLGGFDAVSVAIVLRHDDRPAYGEAWQKPWDERWTLYNPFLQGEEAWKPQVATMAHDLRTWISAALTRQ